VVVRSLSSAAMSSCMAWWRGYGPVPTALKASIHACSLAPLCGCQEDEVIDPEDLSESQVDIVHGDDYSMWTINTDPEVHLVPDFLDDAEVEHLLEITAPLWKPSLAAAGATMKDGEAKADPGRTSSSAALEWAQTPLVQQIEAKLAKLANMSVDHIEGLVCVRYKPGEFFSLHHDGQDRPKTVFVYLNDLPGEDAGGETHFPVLNLRFTPRRGCAIVWPNRYDHGAADGRTCHQALPPRSDIKYGVNCFFHMYPLRREPTDPCSCPFCTANR